MEIHHEEVSALKVGRYMMMDGRPCEIVNMDWSAPGKHGHAKYRVTGIDILTGGKHMGIYTSHDAVEVPIIEKKVGQVLAVTGNKAQLMDMTTYETMDVDVPEEFKEKIQPNAEVVFWEIMDKKVIKQVKSA
ncbi:MAG: translation initiation factor IF-5A [DPANN group archaeon]|nr:translation initiation factor IF-5A [DPANN group archaeon]